MGLFTKFFSQKETFDGSRLYAPVAGRAVAITEVPDPTFSEGILGAGVAIVPSDGRICAPCDARVETMFETGHAVSLVSENGAQILIHIGLETVALEGRPFRVHVKNGDRVKKGQLLIEADLEAIRAAGLNTITPVLVCNADAYSTFRTTVGQTVTTEDVVMELAR